jgi:pimeloyl-ACP methyl ester carboxylesterase
VPVAALHGSAGHVVGAMCERVLAGVGHFPHEERPEEFTRLLLDWLGGL